VKRPTQALSAAWVLVGVVAVVLFDWLLDESRTVPSGYLGGDLRAYFAPAFAYVHATLGAGDLPLWNPYALAGSPFLATHQPGVLYPLWWPFFFLSTAEGISGFVLVHLWLAGFFTWLFVRRLGVSAAAGLAAALAYMLSYWVLSGPFNPAYGATLAWVPGVFWALHRLLSSPGPRNAGLLAGATALAFLAGYAQGFLYLAQFASVYALFRIASSRAGSRLPAAGWAVVAGAVAALLCCAQLLPSFELAGQGTRSLEGLPLGEAGASGSTVAELFALAWGGQGPEGLPWLTLPLAAVALLRRRPGASALFFAGSLLVLADFMRGTSGVLFPVYFELPGGSLFRDPRRAGFLYAFAAAVLIALGAQRIEVRARRRLPALAFVSVLIAAGIGCERYLTFPAKFSFLPLTQPESLEGPAELSEFGRGLGDGSRMFIELHPNGALPYRMGQMHGFGVLPDYEPLLPAAYGRFFDVEGIWHGILAVLPRRVYSGFLARPDQLDWFAVSHYADAGLFPKRRGGVELQRAVGGEIVATGAVPIVERRAALPRAFVARRLEVLPDDRAVLARMRAGSARRTALVTRADLARAGLAPPRRTERNPGEVAIVETTANRVELRASCRAVCFVVLSDLDYPGWHALLDDAEIPVVRTNYLFRGVEVPAGSHRLEFVYRPRAFTVGAALSCVGLAALLPLVWLPGGRAGRRAQPPPGTAAASNSG
jgi:hypothetical protein